MNFFGHIRKAVAILTVGPISLLMRCNWTGMLSSAARLRRVTCGLACIGSRGPSPALVAAVMRPCRRLTAGALQNIVADSRDSNAGMYFAEAKQQGCFSLRLD
jgi:hypothetical protein